MEQDRLPWVGTGYEDHGSLLLVGESHYTNDTVAVGVDPELTRNVITEYLDCQPHRYFTSIGTILTDTPGNQLDRPAFWQSVAFHNYVPAIMPGPGTAPTLAQWVEGAAPFQRVLRACRPRHVIVLGYRLWAAILRDCPLALPGQPLAFEWGPWETAEFPVGNGAFVTATVFKHPSRACRAEWHEVAAAFLGGVWQPGRLSPCRTSCIGAAVKDTDKRATR